MSQSERSKNALVLWRERQQAEKAWKAAQLAELRKDAKTVRRDGRDFTLVRIPDQYTFKGRTRGVADGR